MFLIRQKATAGTRLPLAKKAMYWVDLVKQNHRQKYAGNIVEGPGTDCDQYMRSAVIRAG